MRKMHIEGMTCEKCAEAVKAALLGVTGVLRVDTRLEDGVAMVVLSTALVDEMLIAAVKKAGYEVSSVEVGGYTR